MKIKTRFAPSPTGYLHVGGARTALYSWLFARNHGGEFVLRIEDTDLERSTPEAIEAIMDGMNWLSLEWDEGPYYQTKRFDRYNAVIDQMLEEGTAYKCYCSKERLEALREEQMAKGEKPRYDGRCRHSHEHHADDEPCVVRFANPQEGSVVFDDQIRGPIEFSNQELDDLIIRRTDGSPTYNFCVVVDDWDMEITHVIRGEDHINNTPRQINILKALKAPVPVYAHVSMINGDDGKKLSKRHGDKSFEDLVREGYVVEAIVNYIALLGWSPSGTQEIFSLKELEENFDMAGLSKSPAIFDIKKLTWMNSEYLKAMDFDKYYALAEPKLKEALGDTDLDLKKIAALLQKRLETLNDIPGLVEFFKTLPEYGTELYTHKKMKTNDEIALSSLEAALPVLENLADWNTTSIHDALMALVGELGIKNGQLLWPVRTALSGEPTSPGGAMELADILGKEESLRRIRKGIELLKG